MPRQKEIDLDVAFQIRQSVEDSNKDGFVLDVLISSAVELYNPELHQPGYRVEC